MSFTDLSNWNPALRQLWVTLLVVLWVGATIANLATIFGLSVSLLPLAGVSLIVGALLARGLGRVVAS